MGNDLVERLRSAMCPGSERCNVLTCYPDCECGAMEAAAARIEALEEALKPFAHQGMRHHSDKTNVLIVAQDIDGEQWDLTTITVGDLRRAARALSGKGE